LVRGTLLGRDRDVADGLALVDAATLITLVGPGGVGKTRLAVEVGWELMDRRREGVWFVDLAPIVRDADVARTVAEVLVVHEGAGRSLAASIGEALEGRDLVLVLDNCEQVLVGVRDLVEVIGGRCRTVTVLATSRERLGVRGERVVGVAPLATPDATTALPDAPAVQLFIERAMAADSALTLGETALDSIASICRQLDGMPLALELAAARVRGLGIEGLAGRLDDRLRLLRNPGVATPRHQTLRAAVTWSYDLLDEGLQLLFRRASVFAGAFTLEAAQQVLGFGALDGLDVVDGIAELVDKSMVLTLETPGGRCYRLLETLRQFAAESVDPDDITATRQRLLAWYLAWIARADEGLRAADSARWFDAIKAELDNLREVYWLTSASGDLESAACLIRALDVFLDHSVVAEPYIWANDLARRLGPTDPHFAEVLAIAARGSPDRTTRAHLLTRIMVAEAEGQVQPSARAQHAVAMRLWFLGGTDAAVVRLERAISAARLQKDLFSEGYLMAALSMVQDSFDRERAAASARSAIAVAQASGSSLPLAYGMLALIGTLLHKEPEEALPIIRDMLALAEASGDRWHQATAMRLHAQALSRTGRVVEASTAFGDALALNGVGDYGELLWYSVLNVIEHLLRVENFDASCVALGAFEAARTAPQDTLVQHAVYRLKRALDGRLGPERRSALEVQGRSLTLADFLTYLDRVLRS
jgi:predicted ATPase